MNSMLNKIIENKKTEVANLTVRIMNDLSHPMAKILRGDQDFQNTLSFKQSLNTQHLAVIAEIKRRSPSEDLIGLIPDPNELAMSYLTAGANALSILTDQTFFGGHISDLTAVALRMKNHTMPILRKDFIIDPIQIVEAALSGAQAVLLIVAALGDKVKSLLKFSQSLGLDALVEIHDEDELKIALDCGAEIIGVNSRDLHTLTVEPQRSFELADKIPRTIISVAESGITEPELAVRYHQAGFNAVLIGKALVQSTQPKNFIDACKTS